MSWPPVLPDGLNHEAVRYTKTETLRQQVQ
jgi:hypothetical protein